MVIIRMSSVLFGLMMIGTWIAIVTTVLMVMDNLANKYVENKTKKGRRNGKK